MTKTALLRELERFKGEQLINAIDQIKSVAAPLGYSVNVTDPAFNTGSIDREPKRLNVHTDAESIVKSFSFG
ncbi:hypothetical protein H8A95_39225 [Bradyrhizobium sp. Pear76]|uniref:hypothetical protein n=1 Tax=Bradyrhizobium oropedii TaxID=1571201 RepID=UPI001E38E7E5|nr:hypothetical protein [Bradyrhizobium oropedii]MCC8968180.1 hypothetical protein [Bradyrhizobium oropedii]